jgi:predicted secreted hydrolase
MRILSALFISFIFFTSCHDEKIIDSKNEIELSKAMGSAADSTFERADKVIPFEFPKDHGPHPSYKTEWWYFTGNLFSEEGDEFGYQFTIFRTALTSQKEERKSEWSSNQIYMGHFAVTDISNSEFYFDEKFSREGNQLAGAKISPINIWLEDWQIDQVGNEFYFNLPKLKISATSANHSIDLTLKAVKPKVLLGDNGLSQKGKQVGNASYYYSYTRLETEGSITIEGNSIPVKGSSWMDREWSTSALDKDQAGWDWFALQLNDNTEIMYYQMRKRDGTPDRFSKGVIVDADGQSKPIKREDVVLNVTNHWTASTENIYPSGWTLEIPNENISLSVFPRIKNQLMDVSVRYWEGAVEIEGMKNKKPILGKGYVELTGY